jgi:methionyl-tRNA formyltransferase
MKLLFLSNNPITNPLKDWLSVDEEVITCTGMWESKIETINPDFVISYCYRSIIPEEVLDILPNRFINLHTSYLPFNRGADPNLWSIADGTPSGVSIHLIDKGVDTGPIIAQEEVIFSDEETLNSSYNLLHIRIQDLFKRTWPKIKEGNYPLISQSSKGTYHSIRDGESMKSMISDYNMTVAEFKKKLALSNSPMMSGNVFK